MQIVVNIDDPVGKLVGKRRPPSTLISSPQETEANRQWAATVFFPRIKKGVYRFKSHEEAHQWLMAHSIQKPAN